MPIISRRFRMDVYLIGSISEDFDNRVLRKGTKLPTKVQVLQVFLFNLKEGKKSGARDYVRAAASCTINKLYGVWEKVQPKRGRRELLKSIIKLEKLHNDWLKICKNRKRRSVAQEAREGDFIERCRAVFDVSRNESSNTFPKPVPKQKLLRVIPDSASSELNSSDYSDSDASSTDPCPNTEKPTGKTIVLTLELAAALDRAKVSDRKATYIIGISISPLISSKEVKFTMSRSSVQRLRAKARKEICVNIKQNFQPKCKLTLHWDGKILPDIHNEQRFDRLPILVSGPNIDKLLCVPALKRGTGALQGQALLEAVQDWGLEDNLACLCSDTEAANTGHEGGAAKVFQNLLGRELIYLACRHHVLEIPLQAAVTTAIGPFNSPEVQLFKDFKSSWRNIDVQKFRAAPTDRAVKTAIETEKETVVAFLTKQIVASIPLERQPRDDYLELAELLIIFSGGIPPRGIHFRRPGAVSKTRWMMYAIYAIKIWLFRNQLSLSASQKKGLSQICVYAFIVHAVHWFSAPNAITAPRLDLVLYKRLQEMSRRRTSIAPLAKAALYKLENHLWYLGEHLICLAFFDPDVPVEEKKKMSSALQNNSPSSQHVKRNPGSVSQESSISDLVTKKSLFFFEKLCISTEFLKTSPENWPEEETYIHGKEVCESLVVVNDIAERGVGLVKEYINTLYKKEESLQQLLQVVELHRRLIPTSPKKGDIQNVQLKYF
ncbi:hypothetical protein FOCC_FOCC015302 [Frankliniella occidentalis]|nr:hypothetical protein FOCC_FOCC015302 [Frankliniella occidentalis]